ncbi:DNA-binding response regulator [Ornithinibacillus salinisoli]|uniref:DNA-binding response regulator n=1 Tax=Ornithinibacillus salinisoli TaxID=1848459 RepID=A0ABW4W3R8_9BACI
MGNILMIKEKDLVRDVIIEKLQEMLPQHKLTAYNSVEFSSLQHNEQKVDLLILDMNTRIDILEAIETYGQHHTKIAVWSSELESDRLSDLFKLGLHGYFYNGMEISELIFAIKTMLNGTQYIHSQLASALLSDYVKITNKKPIRPSGILTEQEWNVLEHIVKGHNNGSIASSLFISANTVNNHVSSILKKLHVSDRTNAVIVAVKNNWVTL